MFLSLTFPSPWVISGTDGGARRAVLPGAHLVVEWGALTALPDEQGAWISRELRRGLRPGEELEAHDTRAVPTDAGWPLRMVVALVHDVAGAIVELRAVAAYAFLEHAAAVLIRARDLATYPAQAPALTAILAGGRPVWAHSGRPSHLDAQWNLDGAAGEAERFAAALRSVRALHAAGRHDEGTAARRELRELWRTSGAPRVSLIDELAFDAFEVDGVTVEAFETLRSHDAEVQVVMTFRTVERDEDRLPVTLRVETSAAARHAGAPFVLALTCGTRYEPVTTWPTLPAYDELRGLAARLLNERAPSLRQSQ